ncbi:MAG: ABC transporter permease [Gammaproteobacteria bacterium]|nr:MAG: ABC transporter permease [Gammaproteobacteria bacterium]
MLGALKETLFGSALARFCSVWIILVLFGAMFGTTLSGWDPEAIDWEALEIGPNSAHWFGTDLIGRDLFARIMLGAQVSLTAALIATTVSILIGVPYGAFAGLRGGRTDQVMMRIVDVLYAVPFILVVILLMVVFGRDPLLFFFALGAVYWLDIARIVRGQTLAIREQAYIQVARTMGAGRTHILFRHVVPNVAGPALVYATLTIPAVILAESFISFLGLGVQEPQTSWGVLIADGTRTMESAPWTLFFPALCLGLTVWSFNMLGDRLRDQYDRETRGYTRNQGIERAASQ